MQKRPSNIGRGYPNRFQLLRGMQERGDLVQDSDGSLVEGVELDWDRLPA